MTLKKNELTKNIFIVHVHEAVQIYVVVNTKNIFDRLIILGDTSDHS